jgi:hypothetical protein
MLMEIQKSMGKLETQVETLCEESKEYRKRLGRVEFVVYCATVILAIAGIVGGWVINSAKEIALLTYKATLEAQKPPERAPAPPKALPPAQP